MKTRCLSLAAAAILLTAAPASAETLDCGTPPEKHPAADLALTAAITSPKTEAGANGALRDAVKRLRSDGVSAGLIVDHAVAAYCPLVAKESGLSIDRKREAVRRFASELTSYVYDPAQADDALIVSLPIPPALSAQVDAAAAEAGRTRDEWMLAAVKKALEGR